MISLTPLFELPLVVAIHLSLALLAIALGPFALYRRRRDGWHRALGYLWVSAMSGVAVSAFWLSADILPVVAGYGPIHLLSLWVLFQLVHGVREARLGEISRHQARMRGLYWYGLILPGLFTVMPGRVLSKVAFAGAPELALMVIAAVALAWAGLEWRRRGGFGHARQ